MDLETIALIAMGGCLFLWLVVNFIITLHNVRKAKAAGLTVQVQCEKCGTIYEVTGKEATRPAMIKYKKSSRTHISNGAFVNTQKYSHYAKKFYCPCCDKKTYGKVLDIQELQYEGQDSTIKELGKGFLRMVIGCTIILILAQIPFQIGKKQREREVQQMKEQQYEDLKNKADNRNLKCTAFKICTIYSDFVFSAFYSCGHNRLHKRVYRGRYQIICQRNVIHKKSYCVYNPP